MRPLLILRPEPAALDTLSKCKARGLPATLCTLFAVQPIAWAVPAPGDYFGLLLTSANTIRYGGAGLAKLRLMPVFAVGEATRDAALAAGFSSVVTGDGDVARLLAHIATFAPQRLLHLAGADFTAVDVAGIEVDRLIIYKSQALPMPETFAALIATSPVVMLHSPRAAARFAALCTELNVNRSTISLAAISANAARAAGEGWEAIAIAANPRDEALTEIAEALCNAG